MLLREAAGLDKGSPDPGNEAVGTVTDAQVAEIAKIKMPDLNANDLEAAKLQVAGTARSMGIDRRLSLRTAAPSDPPRSTGTTSPGGPTHEGANMAKGKKYNDATKRFDRDAPAQRRRGASTSSRAWPRPSSTRPSSWPSASASTPARPTRWCAAPSPCPSGTGKDVRVAVFAAGDAAADGPRRPAPTSSAPTTWSPQVEGGMLDFDVAIATPDLMPMVGKLGRVLGPRGLMPNPKTGTVTTDVGKAVAEFKGGKVEYRTDRYGNVHVPIGKVSFAADALLANFRAVLDELAAGQAGLGQGPLPPQDRRLAPPWAPASRSTPTASRSPRTTDA